MLTTLLLIVPSLVARYRSSDVRTRQQMKWLAWSFGLLLIALPVGSQFGLLSNTPVQLSPPLQLADDLLGFAIVVAPSLIIGHAHPAGYRLFDIDVIIRRTLIYSALTAVLALTYFGSVLVLESVFRFSRGRARTRWWWCSRPWPSRRCSGRCAPASSAPSTGASSGSKYDAARDPGRLRRGRARRDGPGSPERATGGRGGTDDAAGAGVAVAAAQRRASLQPASAIWQGATMKVVIFTLGSRGDVQPYLALAVGLQRAGHRVTLATSDSEFTPLIESYGVAAAPGALQHAGA